MAELVAEVASACDIDDEHEFAERFRLTVDGSGGFKSAVING